MTVGLVIVSHSATLARGVVELAGQMAPDVTLVPVGLLNAPILCAAGRFGSPCA